jgi:hypothetical protein
MTIPFKILSANLAVLFLGFITITQSACNPRENPIFRKAALENEQMITRQTEEAIKNSPVLQELDAMCKQIPLPANSQFIWKGGLDDQTISLSYHYYSETKYEEAWSLFKVYFLQNGWKLTKEDNSYPKIIEFRNDKYRVQINYGGMGEGVNYGFSCEKL